MTSPGQVTGLLGPVQGSERERLDYWHQRQRLCRLGDACDCDHTSCTRGWLDDELLIPGSRGHGAPGQTYTTARRCPVCHSAWLAHVDQLRQEKP